MAVDMSNVVSITRSDTPHYCELPISEIVVQGRHRADLGDIKALAESIESIGLIHAPAVTPDHHLLAGERRLAALRMLGRTVVPVVVIHKLTDATDRLRAERDENTCRKDFTASELVSIGCQIEELERPRQDQARIEGNRRGSQVTNLGQSSIEPRPDKSSTNKVVGEALGVSESTYKRAKTVVKATEDADPVVAEIARDQLAKLDAGEVSYTAADQAVRDVRNRKKEPIDFTDPGVDAEASEPEVIPGLPTKVKGPRPNHLKMLTRIVVDLSGTVMALDGIEEVNDTVNAEEARRLMSDLSPSIRSLNRINKLLKERIR